MLIFNIGRKINKYIKARNRANADRFLSPVRRIERTAPLSCGRFVAMTFDDGPCAAPLNPPGRNFPDDTTLTAALLDTLKAHGAKGTFDIIGTTEYNYPDKPGKTHTASWSGVQFDHYPDFSKDILAGVKNQPGLVKRMVDEGHELANHGYKHIIYGPMRVIYGNRYYFKNLGEVVEDLSTLHNAVLEQFGVKLRLARPPHYIDRIPGGSSSYEAYKLMNYQYLAASFDGGGWKPSSGDFDLDIKAMVRPLEEALIKNPESLNGQIIFQKDGYNMSRQSPVAEALEKHLRLLSDTGYKVITVSDLLSMSPFEDISDNDPCFKAVQALANAGFCIGYRSNTFQPDRVLTRGELAVMLTPPEILREGKDIQASNTKIIDVPTNHPYHSGIKWGVSKGLFKCWKAETGLFKPDEPVSIKDFDTFLEGISSGRNIHWEHPNCKNAGVSAVSTNLLQRRDVMDVLMQYYMK